MKKYYCDVCGEELTRDTHYKSAIYDYDLCPKHKEKEKTLNVRKQYLQWLREETK